MKILATGIITTVLEVIGIGVWFIDFFQVLAGVIPIGLIIGGCLAMYLGYDEIRDARENENQHLNELEELKKEVEAMKNK